MDTYVQKISKSVSLVASKKTWIEDLAVQQLVKTSELEGMTSVVGMPDLHPGKSYPIGAAFFSLDRIYPALVGNDIGCGMSLWQSDQLISKLNKDKWVKKLKDLESPLAGDWQSLISEERTRRNIDSTGFDSSLGTIGGGNHFAEFQEVDEVINDVIFNDLNLDKNNAILLVHSGSRGLGHSILDAYLSAYNHDAVFSNTQAFFEYMNKHNMALRWAELNRYLIAKRFCRSVNIKANMILDVNHNLVTEAVIDNQTGYLHRKGATPSDKGVVVIPGSRGDYTYLVKPLDNDIALNSLAHGAGRKWKRGDCQARLSSKYSKEDLNRTKFGSRVICGNKELLYDEAPQAYKKCSSVIESMLDAGLIEVIAKLKPLITFKTEGSCS
ncbi:MAG: release factor H-coupled RctB family protein [Oceanicoccus sp.]|jgi:release factor H-coupled RctB family protein